MSAQILSEEKCVLYTHCYGHALNLNVGNVMMQCKVCSDALDMVFAICKLIKFSPKHNAAFDRKSESTDEDFPVIGIRKFCPTRSPDGLSKVSQSAASLATIMS